MTSQNPSLRYQVITRVPDPDLDPTATGNLYDAIGWWPDGGDYDYKAKAVRDYKRGSMWMPVFELGEVVIVNESGREVVGHGRKADKWDVGYEEFDDIEQAIARAIEVSRG
jgi:hypothetical protein